METIVYQISKLLLDPRNQAEGHNKSSPTKRIYTYKLINYRYLIDETIHKTNRYEILYYADSRLAHRLDYLDQIINYTSNTAGDDTPVRNSVNNINPDVNEIGARFVNDVWGWDNFVINRGSSG